MAVTLVVAWSSDLQEIPGFRRSANMRHAREMATELGEDYPWSPRISFYAEVDFNATEAGMTEEEKRKALERIRSNP